MLDAKVKQSGPVFDGRGARMLAGAIEDGERAIADTGRDMILAELPRVLKHPTGRYQRTIHVMREGPAHLVTDGGIVYGPWLEGTGSRNRTTRFKGYATFRRVSQRLDRVAPDIMERHVDRAARKL